MSKNVMIHEGGDPQALNQVAKIRTSLVGGGTCLWVPEDEVQLTTKVISKDGTYRAIDDGYYGYSQVQVTGAGNVVMGDVGVKKITENGTYLAKDDNLYGWWKVEVNVSGSGSGGGGVTGIDPTTGEEVTMTQDPETGELVKELAPVKLHILKNPNTTTYLYNSIIEYEGISVEALTSNNETWTNEVYTSGRIPFNELIFPVKRTAANPEYSGGGGEGSGEVVIFGAKSHVSDGSRVFTNIQSDKEYNYMEAPSGVQFCSLTNTSGDQYIVAIWTEQFTLKSYHTVNSSTEEPRLEATYTSSLTTYNGQDWHCASIRWYSPKPEPQLDTMSYSDGDPRLTGFEVMLGLDFGGLTIEYTNIAKTVTYVYPTTEDGQTIYRQLTYTGPCVSSVRLTDGRTCVIFASSEAGSTGSGTTSTLSADGSLISDPTGQGSVYNINSTRTYGQTTCYYHYVYIPAHEGSQSVPILGTVESLTTRQISNIAWMMAYLGATGTGSGNSMTQNIPVQWRRPSDRKLLQTSFQITVTDFIEEGWMQQ